MVDGEGSVADLITPDDASAAQRADAARVELDAKEAKKAAKAAEKAAEKAKVAERARKVAEKAGNKAATHYEKALAGLAGGTVTARKEEQALAGVMPDKAKIRIRWRDLEGKLHLVHDYTVEEVGLDGDVGAFINKRLRPTIGDYEYVISLVKEDGTNVPYGTVPQVRPTPSKDNGGTGDAAEVIRATLEHLKSQQQAPAADPLDQMTKMMTLMEQMRGGGEGNKGGGMGMMEMMMMRDMMAPKPTTPALDPQLVSLIERLDTRLDSLERKVDAPAPVLSPISNEPVEPPIDIVRLVEAMRPAPAPPDTDKLTAKDMLELVERMRPPEKEGFTLEKVITLGPALAGVLNTVTGRDLIQKQLDTLQETVKGGSGGLEDELARLVKLQQILPRLFPGGGSKSNEGWIDFVTNAWETLPNTIRQSRGLVHDIIKAQEKVPRQPQRPARQPTAQPATDTMEDAGEPVDEDGSLDMNEEGMAAIKLMVDGETVGEILEASVEFLRAVAPIPSWRKYVSLLVYMAQQGNEEKVIEILDGISSTLVEVDVMSAEDQQRILGVYKDNLEIVMRALAAAAEFDPEEDVAVDPEIEPGA